MEFLRLVNQKKYFVPIAIGILGFAGTILSVKQCTKSGDKIGFGDIETIKKNGILHAVTNYNTINYFVENGETKGLQYDFLRAYCKSENLKLDLKVENNYHKNLEMLQSGKVDLVASMLFPERILQRDFSFCRPFYQSAQVLVQSTGRNKWPRVKYVYDLIGQTVHLPAQSPYVERIEYLSEELGDSINIVQYSEYGPEQLVTMVAANEIPYTVVEQKLASVLAEKFPNLDIMIPVSFEQNRSWVIRKSDENLLKSINQWIIKYKQTPEFYETCKKYNFNPY